MQEVSCRKSLVWNFSTRKHPLVKNLRSNQLSLHKICFVINKKQCVLLLGRFLRKKFHSVSDSTQILYFSTLIEELIRGYETSFKFFVDGLCQVVLLFSAKLRSEGDISAEDLRKVCTLERFVHIRMLSMSDDLISASMCSIL